MGDYKESEDEKEMMVRLFILVIIFAATMLALAIWDGFFNYDKFHGKDEFYTIESAVELQEKVENAVRAIPGSWIKSFNIKQKGDKFKVDYWVSVPVGVKFPYGEAGRKMWVLEVIYGSSFFLCAAFAFALINVIRMSRAVVKVGDNTAKHLGYPPQLVERITIPPETTGIIAIRKWVVIKGRLHSLVTGSEWVGSVGIADKPPEKNNSSGIYAIRLGFDGDWSGNVAGIVACYGKCRIGEKKGIIRAERADIIMLIVAQNGAALSQRYGVPVLVAKDEHIISRWLVTDEGIYWLKHNEKLINSLIGKPTLNTSAVEKQIAEILKDKKF